jgi:hypothetical protein
VFDDLAVLVKAEDVYPGVVMVAGPLLTAVEYHHVALGESPLEVDFFTGEALFPKDHLHAEGSTDVEVGVL